MCGVCESVCESGVRVHRKTREYANSRYENEVMRYDKLGSRGLRFDVAPVINSKSVDRTIQAL